MKFILAALMMSLTPERAMDPGKDLPDRLDSQAIEYSLPNLDQMTERSLNLDIQPWAGSYWPMIYGLTANRYADPGFSRLTRWDDRFSYVQSQSIEAVLAEPDPWRRAALIDQLSPAEKYDLLVGDRNMTLSRAQWAEGERYFAAGRLEEWFGICEGWAAAAVMYPEPSRPVDLISATGDPIRFHALDIKALASLLWSAYNTSAPVTGSRCLSGDEESCFDANPASIHLAVLNILGRSHRPVFVNRVPQDEVWNVPVVGYSVSYFDVTSFWGGRRERLEEAIRPVSEIRNDRHSGRRAPGTAAIVGVNLKLNIAEGYTDERDAQVATGIYQYDYKYDLELDEGGRIIGGEWHVADHPDFLWTIYPGFRPESRGDRLLNGADWNGGVVPGEWLPAIQTASAANQPLELIVRRLVEMSTQR